jgi:hypothetical protein
MALTRKVVKEKMSAESVEKGCLMDFYYFVWDNVVGGCGKQVFMKLLLGIQLSPSFSTTGRFHNSATASVATVTMSFLFT